MKLSLERVEHLKNGLEEVISKVENNNVDKYAMDKFSTCILGVNFGVNLKNQKTTLMHLFGIQNAKILAYDYGYNKTKLEAMVLWLFTTHVADKYSSDSIITKEEWLKEANKVLKKLNKAIDKRKKVMTVHNN